MDKNTDQDKSTFDFVCASHDTIWLCVRRVLASCCDTTRPQVRSERFRLALPNPAAPKAHLRSTGSQVRPPLRTPAISAGRDIDEIPRPQSACMSGSCGKRSETCETYRMCSGLPLGIARKGNLRMGNVRLTSEPRGWRPSNSTVRYPLYARSSRFRMVE